MTHEEFMRSEVAQAVLERAATGAGTPLSVHYVSRTQEGDRLGGWGQCRACKLVADLPGGTTACRLSRTTASTMALRQQRPIAYLCHLGFACVALAPFPDESVVITLGPYCPMEEQRSLADDVQAGLEALHGAPVDTPPQFLDDIHRAPASAVPAIAAWLGESLAEAWRKLQVRDGAVGLEEAVPTGDSGNQRPSRSKTEVRDKLVTLSREIAAALTAESEARARALLLGHLEEADTTGKNRSLVHRTRVATLVPAIMEALGRAGVSVDGAWPGHLEFIRKIPHLSGDRELVDAAIGVFSFLRRKEARTERAVRLPDYPELYALVSERLPDGITLDRVARELGQTPSAISHRLKRKFGMSFSDYVGRIRIDMAKELIRRTELNATEIAHRVGIGDQSNFGKLFKKMEGISPTEYRKAHGKG